MFSDPATPEFPINPNGLGSTSVIGSAGEGAGITVSPSQKQCDRARESTITFNDGTISELGEENCSELETLI